MRFALASVLAISAWGCGRNSNLHAPLIYRGSAGGASITLTFPSRRPHSTLLYQVMVIRFTTAGENVRLRTFRALQAGNLEVYCVASYQNGESTGWWGPLKLRPTGDVLRFSEMMDPRVKPPLDYVCGLGVHKKRFPISFGKYVGQRIVAARLEPAGH